MDIPRDEIHQKVDTKYMEGEVLASSFSTSKYSKRLDFAEFPRRIDDLLCGDI